jgi:hypothetical protein
MSKLPALTPAEVIKILVQNGFDSIANRRKINVKLLVCVLIIYYPVLKYHDTPRMFLHGNAIKNQTVLHCQGAMFVV